MKKLITDADKLRKQLVKQPPEPLKFDDTTSESKEEGTKIIDNIKKVLNSTPGLVALSAPQVGYNKRIFCIKFDDTIKTFINPIIIKKSGIQISPETFASMPNKEILTGRPTEVTVVYYTEDFKYEENKLLDAAAKIFDQQAQVLDCVLPDDVGLVSDIMTDGPLADLSEEEIAEATEVYKKWAKIKAQQLEADIGTDEVLAAQYKQLKFTENVINGRTQVVANEPKIPMNRAQRRAVKKMKGKKK